MTEKRDTFKLLAGPFHRPDDDKELATIITGLKAKKSEFKLTVKKTGIYVWTKQLSIGITKEQKGYITPPAMRVQKDRVNWKAVDWSKRNRQIAAELKANESHVSHMRARYAPETSRKGHGGRKVGIAA